MPSFSKVYQLETAFALTDLWNQILTTASSYKYVTITISQTHTKLTWAVTVGEPCDCLLLVSDACPVEASCLSILPVFNA